MSRIINGNYNGKEFKVKALKCDEIHDKEILIPLNCTILHSGYEMCGFEFQVKDQFIDTELLSMERFRDEIFIMNYNPEPVDIATLHGYTEVDDIAMEHYKYLISKCYMIGLFLDHNTKKIKSITVYFLEKENYNGEYGMQMLSPKNPEYFNVDSFEREHYD